MPPIQYSSIASLTCMIEWFMHVTVTECYLVTAPSKEKPGNYRFIQNHCILLLRSSVVVLFGTWSLETWLCASNHCLVPNQSYGINASPHCCCPGCSCICSSTPAADRRCVKSFSLQPDAIRSGEKPGHYTVALVNSTTGDVTASAPLPLAVDSCHWDIFHGVRGQSTTGTVEAQTDQANHCVYIMRHLLHTLVDDLMLPCGGF